MVDIASFLRRSVSIVKLCFPVEVAKTIIQVAHFNPLYVLSVENDESQHLELN
jgi:hypothetical protein